MSFAVAPQARTTACHCSQCRKQSDHHCASGQAWADDFAVAGAVRWYESSLMAKRGFCPTCGCFLFWRHNDEDTMSFSRGAINGNTGLHLGHHTFTADKGDYYDIADGVPQRED